MCGDCSFLSGLPGDSSIEAPGATFIGTINLAPGNSSATLGTRGFLFFDEILSILCLSCIIGVGDCELARNSYARTGGRGFFLARGMSSYEIIVLNLGANYVSYLFELAYAAFCNLAFIFYLSMNFGCLVLRT